jgi:hypothetical protein
MYQLWMMVMTEKQLVELMSAGETDLLGGNLPQRRSDEQRSHLT